MTDYPPPPPPQQPYGAGPVGEVPLSQPLRGASPRDAIVRFFKKYASFEGRASRSEFWWPWLFSVVVNMAINLLLGADSTAGSIIGGIFALAILVPSLAVGARRLHDTGRSGWWQLLWLLPCIGWIVLIVFWALPEKAEGDKYNLA
ncbi:DUF805 domain-containing protein [Nocardioides sp. NPDC047086]|uniref:DUF805 domain-containing protein n=1 Tax=Nocardioides sp. NPDC047086 TaxID=3154810 RepID=UPI0033DEF1B7